MSNRLTGALRSILRIVAPSNTDVAAAVSVTSTSQVSLCAASTQVGTLVIQNMSATLPVFVGPNGLTTANGIQLDPAPESGKAGGSVTLSTGAAMYARTASGSAEVRVLRTVL